MNSLRIAQLQLSPLRVQQGLFVSLIVLLTLLATQQLHRWDQAKEATAIQQSFISHSSMPSSPLSTQFRTPVSAPSTANKPMPVDRLVSQDVPAQPTQQRWVF